MSILSTLELVGGTRGTDTGFKTLDEKYVQNHRVAFGIRGIYVALALVALTIYVTALCQHQYGSMPDDSSLANNIELSKFLAMAAGGVFGIAILRDLYASVKACHAAGIKQGARIAGIELAATVGTLPFAIVAIVKLGFSSK